MTVSMPTATTSSPSPTIEPKRIDLFKPLYKRDRALQTSEAGRLPPAITDPRLPVSALNANENIPYTFRSQPYRLQDTAKSNLVTQQENTGFSTECVRIRQRMHEIFSENGFLDETTVDSSDDCDTDLIQVLTIDELPGAAIITQFLPVVVQARLTELVIEELIGDPRHKSNLDAHYENPQALLAQMFTSTVSNREQQQPVLVPRDPTVHAPLPLPAVRDKKLRWITLGGQYNWTTKVYPSFARTDPAFPQFPPRVASLFSPPLFAVRPEAAIVNFYSQGDVLSPHQDVAERCNADLISLSVGCDAVFYIGLDRYEDELVEGNNADETEGKPPKTLETNKKPRPPLQLLLRSGDILIMGGAARFAYHGVGRVFRDTAPSELVDTVHPRYRDWLRTKRINVNVRQMLA